MTAKELIAAIGWAIVAAAIILLVTRWFDHKANWGFAVGFGLVWLLRDICTAIYRRRSDNAR